MLNISVINHSTVDLGISLVRLCKLGMDFLQTAVVPYWAGKGAILIPAKQILPNTQAIILMDDGDQQGTLGYHDLTPDGFPLAKIFARTTLADGATVTEVFTHELAEMRCDPDCNLQATDALGNVYALEVGDPCEESLFLLDGYPVSDVVTPAWFEPFHKPGSARFDHLGKVTQPFQLLPGGYAVVENAQTGQVQQIFGSVDKEHRFACEDRRMHRSELRKTRKIYSQSHAAPLYNHALGRRPILTHA